MAREFILIKIVASTPQFSESVLSVEKLSKAVTALKHFSDALYDWAGDSGAELLTTEVSQLNCSHNAQRS